ncbi:MAG: efflux RND transporter periplasmic adaptor subunit, partial [Planctomycetota bacterium]
MSKRLALFSLLVFVSACEPPPEPEPIPPRLVLTLEVPASTPTVERSFSGVTNASDSAELGFEVAGRIIELEAVRGRRYKAGEVLARLDVSNYLEEQTRFEAEATRAAQELKRIQQLFERGNASKSQLDQVIATQRSSAAALRTAKKRVADGVLTMPYGGFVSEVLRERQEVVSAGTPIIRVQGEGKMEMEVGVPRDVVGLLKLGKEAVVRLGGSEGETIAATVSKIASRASADATYAITLSLAGGSDELRAGLDGEATFVLPNPAGSTTAIPSVCVAGSPDGGRFVW